MERLVQKGVGGGEEGLHTHIFETTTGAIEVISKSKDMHWRTFFYFSEYGHEYPFIVMPQLREFTIYKKVLPNEENPT
tara:strand:- start:256 stop:489 length:234 start_codon:yes stop_codon:yes gene_type:complete